MTPAWDGTAPSPYNPHVLDVSLHGVSYRYESGFELQAPDLTFPKSTHTAIVGPPACGASTLLGLIAGELRPQSGEVRIGTRVVNTLGTSRRPLLWVRAELGLPGRWSVRHALVNAVRSRSLDRPDRFHELTLAASKWQLELLLDRRLSTLSATERLRVHLARIELLRPGILVADRLFDHAAPTARIGMADELYRLLRVTGATVISAPSSREELGMTDAVVVLDGGKVVQSGGAPQLFAAPGTEAAAIATGEVNVIPVRIEGTEVESIIGRWHIDQPPFSGNGVALVRPEEFVVAGPGEDSDLIFGIEEAWFDSGRWVARGLLTGGHELRVVLSREVAIRKGRLLALRYDPSRFTLLPRPSARQPSAIPTVVPPMRDSR